MASALAHGQSNSGVGNTAAERPSIDSVSFDCTTQSFTAENSDIWPITWAHDGKQYTAWGDGVGFSGSTKRSYGFATIEGPDPTSLTTNELYEDGATSGSGKFPGHICVDGTFWSWKTLQDGTYTRELFKSTDDYATDPTATGVQFPDTGEIFPTNFIQMGRDYQLKKDDYLYAVGGDQASIEVHLWRAPLSGLETKSNWKYFSGSPSSPAWSSNVADRTTIYSNTELDAKAVVTTISYIPPVDQYVMIYPWSEPEFATFEVLVSDNRYGPWTQLGSWTDFCGLSGNSTLTLYKFIPQKWISSINNGSIEFWMIFSGGGSGGPADSFTYVKGSFAVS